MTYIHKKYVVGAVCVAGIALAVFATPQVFAMGNITVNDSSGVIRWDLTGPQNFNDQIGTKNFVGVLDGTYTLTVDQGNGRVITGPISQTQDLNMGCPAGQSDPGKSCAGLVCQSTPGCGPVTCNVSADCGGGGGGGGGGCFVAGTPVMTPSGAQPIETIQIGDKVLAYDTEGNRSVVSPVTYVEATSTDILTHIELSDVPAITTTPVHRFWTQRGWVASRHLTTDDMLFTKDGSWAAIENVSHEKLAGPTTVYNLHIEDEAHSFYAGGVLVHNLKEVESFDPAELFADLGVQTAHAAPSPITFTILSRLPTPGLLSLSPLILNHGTNWQADGQSNGAGNGGANIWLYKNLTRISTGLGLWSGSWNENWVIPDPQGDFTRLGTWSCDPALHVTEPNYGSILESDFTDRDYIEWHQLYGLTDTSNQVTATKRCGTNMTVISTNAAGDGVPYIGWTVTGDYSSWNSARTAVTPGGPGNPTVYTFSSPRADQGTQTLTVGNPYPPGYTSYTIETPGCPPGPCPNTINVAPWNAAGFFRIVWTNGGAVCGNSAVEAPETCDNGASNGSCPAACSAACTINSCGGPTVITNACTSITGSSFTMNGSVNPNSLATNYWFEWGTTSPPGTAGFPTSAGAGAVPVPVSSNITSLLPATTYYFRTAASNSDGTSRGSILTCPTTGAPTCGANGCEAGESCASCPGDCGVCPGGGPPNCSTFPADNITTTSSDLHGFLWAANGSNADFDFDWGTTPSMGTLWRWPTPGGSAGMNVPFTLAMRGWIWPSTTYWFEAVCTNNDGVSRGGVRSYTTQTPGCPPSLTIVPNPASVDVGNIVQLNSWFDSDGPSCPLPAIDVTALGPWTSSSTLATPQGMLTGRFLGNAPGGGAALIHHRYTSMGFVADAYINVNAVGADFTCTVNPPSLSLAPGASGGGTFDCSALNGFAGVIALSAPVVPPGSSAWFGAPSITIPPPTNTTYTFDTGTLVPGIYSYNIIATSGGLSHTYPVSVTVTPGGGGPHNECVANACTSVVGPGPDRCSVNADCNNSPPIHSQCDAVSSACVNVIGPGPNTCSTDADCGGGGVTHYECQNLSCVIVGGVGGNTCNNVGACTHLDCVASTCSIVGGGGSDLCSPAGSACGLTHNACVDPGTGPVCTLVAGAGFPECAPLGVACVPPLPPSCTMNAIPSIIYRYQNSTLVWSCAGALSSCTINDGTNPPIPVSLAGSMQVSPLNRTTYTINCIGIPGPGVSATAQVTVSTVQRGEIIPR